VKKSYSFSGGNVPIVSHQRDTAVTQKPRINYRRIGRAGRPHNGDYVQCPTCQTSADGAGVVVRAKENSDG